MALSAKWGWRYLNKEFSLWHQVIRSIHVKDLFNWHTYGKVNLRLRSPWINISRTWVKVEALATYKLGNGSRIRFWMDSWVDKLPLNVLFPKLFKVAINPQGSVADRWDNSHLSWPIFFQKQLNFRTLMR